MAVVEQTLKIAPQQIGDKARIGGGAKVAYIPSRFPKLSETFILYEMLALERQGVHIELYPLLRARNTAIQWDGATVWKKLAERFTKERGGIIMHPEAERFMGRAHFEPFMSWPILRSQFRFLFRKPVAYLGALWSVLRGTWGSPNFFLGALAYFPKAAYFAEEMAATEVTHVHATYASHPALVAFVIHRLSGIPYSFTGHGADLQVDQHMLREKVAEAAFAVTISNYNKEFIAETCGEDLRAKILVIHCGVDTDVFQPRAEQAAQAGDRPFSILCTGTMYEVKGHTYLIEACRLLNERGVDFVCHLVGDGPDRAALTQQVANAGLGERVLFHGSRTRAEIAELLQQVDVVAVPSIPTSSGRREGIPVVLMEAMASSVPVVASAISGIPELVDDQQTGRLVPPRDADALADAFQSLFDDPALRQRLGQAGRAKVLREFDLFHNAATLAAHFGAVRG